MYEGKKTIWKGIKYFLFFGIPQVISMLIKFLPEEYTGITVGTALVMFSNWLKHHKDKGE